MIHIDSIPTIITTITTYAMGSNATVAINAIVVFAKQFKKITYKYVHNIQNVQRTLQ